MRKAASLLELVIAIVVMGIAMMTLPLMLTTTQNNNIFAIRQEAIYAARTHIGDILTYLWDEHTMNSSHDIAVLDTNSSNTNIERVSGTMRRIGHVKGDKRRKYFTTKTYATIPTHLGKDGTEVTPNDIDDFNNQTSSVSNGTLDYIYDLSMQTQVYYIDDNFAEGNTFLLSKNQISHSTNIKAIKITVKDTNQNGKDFNITFMAYSCNIGENRLLKRVF